MIIFESKYPTTYRQVEVKKILDYTQTGKFCQLIAVPGVGKATVLKLLAHNRDLLKFHLRDKEKDARYIYINLLEAPSLETEQIAKFILGTLNNTNTAPSDSSNKALQHEINALANSNHTTVFMFDHFDQYQNQLESSFFELLKNIRSAAKYKFSVVFATRRDLKELVDPGIIKSYYDFFTDNAVHLKINNTEAAELIVTQSEEIIGKKLTPHNHLELIKITGGHAKLTKIVAELLLRRESSLDPVELQSKQIVQAALDEVWQFLTANEQEDLKKIAQAPNLTSNQETETLINLDLISKNHTFTIPLLAQYIKTTNPNTTLQNITYNKNTKEIKIGGKILSDLLSKQEYKMLKYLIEKTNQVVTRDELISIVWPEAQAAEGISDEAIDQMVYRLRRKIETDPNSPKYLTTIKGQGWRFAAKL